MFREDRLVRLDKRVRVASPSSDRPMVEQQPSSSSTGGGNEEVALNTFIEHFRQHYPTQQLEQRQEEGREGEDVVVAAERTGMSMRDPTTAKELTQELARRSATLRGYVLGILGSRDPATREWVSLKEYNSQSGTETDIQRINNGLKNEVYTQAGFPSFRFILPSSKPSVSTVQFDRGVFFIDEVVPTTPLPLPRVGVSDKWGVVYDTGGDQNDRRLEYLRMVEQPRGYHDEQQHTPALISGVMESAWRDLYFICAQLIWYKTQKPAGGVVAGKGFAFNNKMSLQHPLFFDQVLGDQFSKKYKEDYTLHTREEMLKDRTSDLGKKLNDSVNKSWFDDDIPMFFQRKGTDAENDKVESHYLLSCLDKAAFLTNYGPIFQASLGYDKRQISSANPFQKDPQEYLADESTQMVLTTFNEDMAAINDLLANWKIAATESVLLSEEGLKIRENEVKKVETDKEEERVKNADRKNISDFLTRVLTDPIAESLKNLEAFKEIALARKRAEIRVLKLTAELLKYKTGVLGGGLGGGGSSGAASEASFKNRKIYVEAVTRSKVFVYLRTNFPLFKFADLVAGGAAVGLQRMLRYDFDDLITKEVMGKAILDGDVANLANFDPLIASALLPFADVMAGGADAMYSSQLQAVVATCFERVKLMIWIAKGARRQGKGSISLKDLTEGPVNDLELVVAFSGCVALELQVIQEVQRKTSSTHHDQIRLSASAQNAENLLRGILSKRGWACFSNAVEEVSHISPRPSHLGF